MFRQHSQHARVRSQAAALIAACLMTVISGATSHAGASDGRQGTNRQDKSQQVFVTVCGRCHPIERITSMRRTRRQWEEAIDNMITARGAQVSDDEFDTILTYLTREYGRVDVNRAPADEIGEVLGIGDEMAAAIVAYRKQHGPFEDFDALLKVPGIDRQALETHRDAIIF